jgi:hypothetical protein
MVQRIDYYTLLSRAVESLERDAYAARGVIYDHEHKALLERLTSSGSPCSDADIAREEQAFRDAIRRIEFPDNGVELARGPPRQPAATAWPNSTREKARALRREFPQAPANEAERAAANDAKREPQWEAKPAARRRWDDATDEDANGKPPGRPLEPAPEIVQEGEPSWNGEERKFGSLAKMAALYMLAAAIVVGAGALGYAYLIGAIDLPWHPQGLGRATPRSERAILYEADQSGGTAKPVEGTAVWRTRMEPTGPAGKSDMLVTLDAEIPEPHIALTMKLSHVGEAGGSMSHLLELGFAKPEELPFGGISRIANIGTKATETGASESLVGTTINFAPGQFMFGLLGMKDVVGQNVERLRTQNWLELTIIFANGAAYRLAIEKGASGERAFNEAFAKWGQ